MLRSFYSKNFLFLGALFIAVIFFVPQPTNAQATEINTGVAGVKMYEFDISASCGPSPNYSNKHAIIIPEGLSSIDSSYLYFHGDDNPSSAYQCSGKYELCNSAKKLKDNGVNGAILLLNRSNSNSPTKAQFECYLNEATKVLKDQLKVGTGSRFIIAAHSKGGKTLLDFLSASVKFDGKSPDKTLIFDGCYSNWCEAIVGASNSGQVLLYAGGSKEQIEAGGSNVAEYTGSKKAFDKNPSKARLVHIPQAQSAVHFIITKNCFAEHAAGKLCNNLGTLIGGGEVKSPTAGIAASTKEPEQKARTAEPPPLPVLGQVCDLKSFTFLPGSTVIFSWVAQCMAGLYKWGVTIAGVIAIVLVMIGGVMMISGGLSSEYFSRGKSYIISALMGFILIISSYLIINIINPAALNFNALSLETVEEQFLPGELFDLADSDQDTDSTKDVDAAGSAVPPTKAKAICRSYSTCYNWCKANPTRSSWPKFTKGMLDPSQTSAGSVIDGPGIRMQHKNRRVPNRLIEPLKKVGQKAQSHPEGPFTVKVNNSYRPLSTQISIVCNNYFKPIFKAEAAGDTDKATKLISTAQSNVGRVVAWPGTSNHGKGQAVDVYLEKNGKELTTMSFGSQTKSRYARGNRFLAEIFYSAGWVRYIKEAWHFEYGRAASGTRTNTCLKATTSAKCPN